MSINNAFAPNLIGLGKSHQSIDGNIYNYTIFRMDETVYRESLFAQDWNSLIR
jgi:hypothetical protein